MKRYILLILSALVLVGCGSETDGSAPSEPVTITVTETVKAASEPVETVTVTASPAPVETVTVEATPEPVETVTVVEEPDVEAEPMDEDAIATAALDVTFGDIPADELASICETYEMVPDLALDAFMEGAGDEFDRAFVADYLDDLCGI